MILRLAVVSTVFLVMSCSSGQDTCGLLESSKQTPAKDPIAFINTDSSVSGKVQTSTQPVQEDSSVACPCAISGFIESDSIYVYPKLYGVFKDEHITTVKLNDQGAFFVGVDGYFESGTFRISNINRGGKGKELNKYKHWWLDELYLNGPDNEFKYNMYSDTSATEVIDYSISTTFKVLECRGKWIYTKGLHQHEKDGKRIESKSGWMPYELLCPNPFTNCADLKWKKHVYKGNTVDKRRN